jgi:hypothetical protein
LGCGEEGDGHAGEERFEGDHFGGWRVGWKYYILSREKALESTFGRRREYEEKKL